MSETKQVNANELAEIIGVCTNPIHPRWNPRETGRYVAGSVSFDDIDAVEAMATQLIALEF